MEVELDSLVIDWRCLEGWGKDGRRQGWGYGGGRFYLEREWRELK